MDTNNDDFVTYKDVKRFLYENWPTWWPDFETKCAEANCDNYNYQTFKYSDEILK